MPRSRAILRSKSILVVDENAYVALDLAAAVEAKGGTVLGPVGSVDEALSHLAANRVDAAILDGDLGGAAAIAARLSSQQIPFVVQGGTTLTVGLRGLCDRSAMLTRPVDSTLVVTLLAIELEKDADRTPLPMPLPPIRA